MTKDEARELWELAKANGRKLDACACHEFELIGDPEQSQFGRRYRCLSCFGEVDSHAKHWYELGRKHAAKFARK
jgi:hypothetical protein